jgi:hypothetical protein
MTSGGIDFVPDLQKTVGCPLTSQHQATLFLKLGKLSRISDLCFLFILCQWIQLALSLSLSIIERGPE